MQNQDTKHIRHIAYGIFVLLLGFSLPYFITRGYTLISPKETTDSKKYTPVENLKKEEQTKGLTMFRGNKTRTWYGTGNVKDTADIMFTYPEKRMCAYSVVGLETKEWCGSGWTGQPVVWERPDGITEVIFGAYDKKIHFINAETGKETRPSFETGDIIKGSVTLDPNNFPYIYFGSRDNKLRIVSLYENTPKEVWSLDAYAVDGIWNNDWDGNPVIDNDILYEGGENGWFFAIKLNRTYKDSVPHIEPQILFQTPGYTDELIEKMGPNLGIENSVALYNDRVYFGNSGGRITGLDISNIKQGIAPVVFQYEMGDDVDATIVIDEEGMLYVASEEEKYTTRAGVVGQLVKLNPYSDTPLVWNIHFPKKGSALGGIWATPALHNDYLYVASNTGNFSMIHKNTGEVLWTDDIGAHAWSSPIISDDQVIVANCKGEIRAYSQNKTKELLFTKKIKTGSCIESTPALWNGALYFGARDGFFYKIQ